MSRVIWKFDLDPWCPSLQMPEKAQPLHVHEQNGKACLWALVDPDAPLVTRRIVAHPTGARVRRGPYVGTFHIDEGNGPLVFHVFDEGEVAA